MLVKVNLSIKNIGKYIKADGESYEGDFKNDLRDGFGIIKYVDGRVYEGEMKNDLRNGIGKWN